jgi:AcrR family transcriptional regulator
MQLLDERGPDGFTIDDVLVRSDASASSLYHHFGNREGLMVAAQRERYRETMVREDPGHLAAGLATATTEEFFAYIATQLRRIATDPATREVRRDRLAMAARALHSPELTEASRGYQERFLAAMAEVFADAQQRGLINRDLDVLAYCAWFHGMTLGRTVTEGGSVDAEAWLRVAIPAALAPLDPAAATGGADPGAGEPGTG